MFALPSLNVITACFPSLIAILCSAFDTEAISEIDVILKLLFLFLSLLHTAGTFSWSLGFGSPCPQLPSHLGVYVVTHPMSITSPAHLSAALTFW